VKDGKAPGLSLFCMNWPERRRTQSSGTPKTRGWRCIPRP